MIQHFLQGGPCSNQVARPLRTPLAASPRRTAAWRISRRSWWHKCRRRRRRRRPQKCRLPNEPRGSYVRIAILSCRLQAIDEHVLENQTIQILCVQVWAIQYLLGFQLRARNLRSWKNVHASIFLPTDPYRTCLGSSSASDE